MRTDHLVLLPGLDGTGRLFGGFLAARPARFTAEVLAYPPDATSYEELASCLRPRLAPGRPFWLVAESFAGPLAVALAASGFPELRGIIFVCSFVRCPRPFWLRALPWRVLTRLPAPGFVLCWSMTGFGAAADLVRELKDVRRRVPAAVVAGRLESAASVDASRGLVRCALPTLYLQAHRDRIVLRGSADHVSTLKPDTEVVVLDTPHLLLQTAPLAAWAAVASFIDAQRPVG